MPTGYSGKPLAAKLDLKQGQKVLLVNAPADFDRTLGAVPAGVRLVRQARGAVDAVHLFVARRTQLERRLPALQSQVAQGGMIWISWPKKSSGVETDITGDTLREVVLPTGWVDVKICAVDETWSGLKFLRRRRPGDIPGVSRRPSPGLSARKPGRPTANEAAAKKAAKIGPKRPARAKAGAHRDPAAAGGSVQIPADLRRALAGDPQAKAAFDAMPPSQRRRYAEHAGEAKRQRTRNRRIESSLRMMKGWAQERGWKRPA